MVDAGDVFHTLVTLLDSKKALVTDRAYAYIDVFNEMGHDAQGIGDRDLAIGIPLLKNLSKKAKFPFIASNILDAQSGAPVFQQRMMIIKDGVKVGIFGLITPNYRMRERHEKDNGIRIADPVEIARVQVAALKKDGAQVVAVLSHLTLEESNALAKEVPGITVMLGSQSQKLQRYPRAVGNTYITDGYMKGKYLSVLTLFVDPADSSFRFVDPNRKTALNNRVQELEVRISSRKRAIEGAAQRKTGGNNSQWLERNLAEAEKELIGAQADLNAYQGEELEGRSFIAYDFPPMVKTIEDDTAVVARLNILKKKYPNLKPGH